MNVVTVTLNPCIDKTVELDAFEIGQTNRAVSVRTDVGGKGINVSKILHSFGIENVASGIIAGETGKQIERYLLDMGIGTDFTVAEGETRMNLKIFDRETTVTTEINEPGFEAGAAYDEFRDRFDELLEYCDLLVLSGSAARDIGDAVYAELISIAAERGVRTILDAQGEKLRRGIEAHPYAIKPNKAEFEQLVGEQLIGIDDIVRHARAIVASGVELVVVSLGSEGAVFVKDSLVIKTTPFPIETKSAAAAGDAMVGALVHCIDSDMTLTQTAQIMTAAGTITAAKEGTQVATFGEIAANYQRVETQIIDEEL